MKFSLMVNHKLIGTKTQIPKPKLYFYNFSQRPSSSTIDGGDVFLIIIVENASPTTAISKPSNGKKT
jgi:hypothetical protein